MLIKTRILECDQTELLLVKSEVGKLLIRIQAMSTGHDGSMSSGHGNSIKGMLNRFLRQCISWIPNSIYSIKSQIKNALDIIVHLRRDSDVHALVTVELVGFDA